MGSSNPTENSTKAGRQKRPYSRLSKEQKAELQKVINSSPIEYGYSTSKWTGILLSDYIRKHFGIDVTVRTAQRMLSPLQQKHPMYHQSSEEKDRAFIEMMKRYNNDEDTSVWFIGNIPIWSNKPKFKKRTYKKRGKPIRIIRFQDIHAFVAINAKSPNRKEISIVWKKIEENLQNFYIDFINAHSGSNKLVLLAHSTSLNKRIISRLTTESEKNDLFEFVPIFTRNQKLNIFEKKRMEVRKFLRKFDTEAWKGVPPKVINEIKDALQH